MDAQALAYALQSAKDLVEAAYFDERGMADVMRKDAAIWAAIAQATAAQAQAEQLKRIADALEAKNSYDAILA
jgi:hypothetical protein